MKNSFLTLICLIGMGNLQCMQRIQLSDFVTEDIKSEFKENYKQFEPVLVQELDSDLQRLYRDNPQDADALVIKRYIELMIWRKAKNKTDLLEVKLVTPWDLRELYFILGEPFPGGCTKGTLAGMKMQLVKKFNEIKERIKK